MRKKIEKLRTQWENGICWKDISTMHQHGNTFKVGANYFWYRIFRRYFLKKPFWLVSGHL